MNTSIDIPDWMVDAINVLVEKRMTSRSQIIRIAIREHLDEAKESGEL